VHRGFKPTLGVDTSSKVRLANALCRFVEVVENIEVKPAVG